MIYKIAAYTGKEIILQKILPIKRTARSPVQYICKMEGVVVLVVIARSDIQKFYLKRSIEKQEEFADEYDEYFSLNMPIHKGEIDDFYFAVYYYFENSKWTKDKRPLEKLSLLYKQYAKRYSVTEELIQKIEYDFLSAWPVDFHGQIRDLEIYKKYFLLLRKQKDLVIYKEHGDYTTNNILNVGNKQYLMDFEFAKSFQPIWLDYYDYCRTTHRRYDKTWIEDLKIKSLLMDEMNNILDDGFGENLTFFKKLKHKFALHPIYIRDNK
jgi:hypothetical protein